MAVDLGEFVPALRREVSVPGQAGFLDGADDDDLIGSLVDAFWRARLDDFFVGFTCDEDGLITPMVTGGEDLPRTHVSVVVLYAGIKLLRNRILGLASTMRAKAGPVEYESSTSATVLTSLLSELQATQKHLLDDVREEGGYTETPVAVFDWLNRCVVLDPC